MKVEIVDHFGSDKKVFAMARISYGAIDNEECKNEKVVSLIRRLVDNDHLTPFEHCAITYKITCPIFVARQLMRYRTAAISERSLRYCSAGDDSLFDTYTPFFDNDNSFNLNIIKESYKESFNAYNKLVSEGVKKEAARSVLPLGTLTTFYFTINLRNLFNVFKQRISKHSQRDTRDIVVRMFDEAQVLFPITMSAIFDKLDYAGH